MVAMHTNFWRPNRRQLMIGITILAAGLLVPSAALSLAGKGPAPQSRALSKEVNPQSAFTTCRTNSLPESECKQKATISANDQQVYMDGAIIAVGPAFRF